MQSTQEARGILEQSGVPLQIRRLLDQRHALQERQDLPAALVDARARGVSTMPAAS
ncbi:hypothetical protein [Microbacterium sp. NIBRBAC000506063]|uniref:hypothetical protein n=1 Tax=Microbacterium sp. NIBRBAC000506063 TaxID=2734618 RepID=UPI001BB79A19|nr:hypothetical protein [Microbacterium sp. NIBRBAC000506063]QTV79771.1 hypothetical protein KAE78_00245 [Microbacterium sp. NIBRBAC000506063]